jgi:hypothetical protein
LPPHQGAGRGRHLINIGHNLMEFVPDHASEMHSVYAAAPGYNVGLLRVMIFASSCAQ